MLTIKYLILKIWYFFTNWFNDQRSKTSFIYVLITIITGIFISIYKIFKNFFYGIYVLIFKVINPALLSIHKNLLSTIIVIVGAGLITLIVLGLNEEEEIIEVAIEDRPNYEIGAVVSITGQYARIGNEMRRGYETIINIINQNGGITVNNTTHNLNLIVYDDESDPIRAAEVSRLLITENQPPVILAPYSASLAKQVISNAQLKQIPTIVPAASPARLNNELQNVYYLQTPPEKYLTSAANLFFEQIANIRKSDTPKNKKFANGSKARIIFVSGKDPYSELILAQVKSLFGDDKNIELLDFDLNLSKKELDKMKKKLNKSDAMFVSAFANGALELMETIATDGINIPFIALTHCDVAKIHIKTPTAAESALCAIHWQTEANFTSNNLIATKEFINNYSNNYGSSPTYRSAAAAAAINVIYQAINTSANSQLSLEQALSKTKINTLYGPVEFNSNGVNIAKPMIISQIHNSRFEPVLPNDIAMREINLVRPKLASSIK